jgi:hypothetical protein
MPRTILQSRSNSINDRGPQLSAFPGHLLPVVLLFGGALRNVGAETPKPSPSAWPFSSPGGASSSNLLPASSPPSAAQTEATPPPRLSALQQKRIEELSNREISPLGLKALNIKPEQWKQGETENFIIHFRRVADANNVAREIEFDLWYVARALEATNEQYSRKSHVYVFKDDAEWKSFLPQALQAPWVHSFAHGDELFLNVHEQTGAFDSHTVAHETTHAVVARIYRRRSWPLWLNEGFAEYMGDASVAARHSQSLRRNQQMLTSAEMTVAELMTTNRYPTDTEQVTRLYDTSAKFVRYLFNRYPKQLFPRFIERLLSGDSPVVALAAIYGDEFKDMTAFEKKFARFVR